MGKILSVPPALIFLLVLTALSTQAAGGKILCTTFPVYQITRNIAEGVAGLEVELMIPARLGCPHNYSLTPGDMRKIAGADVLVINGLGMEEFLGAPLENANPGIAVINSSRGIGGLLGYSGRESGEHVHEGEEGDHDHSHGGMNPHLFASPAMAAEMVVNIAAGLARIFPERADFLQEKGRRYAGELNQLAVEVASLAGGLANNRIVTQHGAFDYLARDAGLEIVATINAEGGDALSAAGVIRLVRVIKETGAGAVFTEPQYPARIGRTIAAEAGIPAGELDPVAGGPDSAPLDYYETVMRKNIKVLRQYLGAGE